MPSTFKLLLFIATWLSVVVFICLNQVAFEVSEAREGVVVQEIINYNSFILPLRYGSVVPSKPPLYHWLSAGVAKLSGGMSDLALRLPSLLSGLGILLITLFFSKCCFSNSAKSLSAETIALIMASISYCHFQLSGDGRVDMLFALFSVASLLYCIKIILRTELPIPNQKEKFALGLILGLSILGKGPLGPVLFIVGSLPLIIFHALSQKKSLNPSEILKLLKAWYLHIGTLITFLVAAPWYIAAYFVGSDGFVSRQLWFENIARFIGTKGIEKKSMLFYFHHFFTQMSPTGTLTLAICLTILFFKTKKTSNDLFTKLNEQDSTLIKYLCLQAVSLIIFFSLSSGKRRAYLLPLVPHFAIIFSLLFVNFKLTFLNYFSKFKLAPKLFYSIIIFASSISILLSLSSVGIKLFSLSPSYFQNSFLIGLSSLPYSTSLGMICGTLALLSICIYFKRSFQNEATHLSLTYYFASSCLLIYLTLPNHFFLTKGYSHSYFDLASQFSAILPPKEDVSFIKKKEDESLDTFFYYINRRILLHDKQNSFGELEQPSKTGLYLARAEWLNQQNEDFKDHIAILSTGGRIKDPENKKVVLFRLIDSSEPDSTLNQEHEESL